MFQKSCASRLCDTVRCHFSRVKIFLFLLYLSCSCCLIKLSQVNQVIPCLRAQPNCALCIMHCAFFKAKRPSSLTANCPTYYNSRYKPFAQFAQFVRTLARIAPHLNQPILIIYGQFTVICVFQLTIRNHTFFAQTVPPTTNY